MNILDKTAFYIDGFTKFIGRLAAFVLLFLTLLIVYDALSRYLFQTGSIALQELEWHLFDLVILFAVSYTLKENAHVRIDIFYANFSERVKLYINLISLLLFILPFSLLIVYFGYDFVLQSFMQNETSCDPGGLQYRYLVKSLMVISFIFVVLQSFSEIIKNIKALKK